MKNILLVQPEWPIPSRKKRSVHHKYFPTGLLKMSTLFKSQGHQVEFIIGTRRPEHNPDEIYVTSLFTWWSRYVLSSVSFYRAMFPSARITVGGPYITLMSHLVPGYIDIIKSFHGIDEAYVGLYKDAENCLPDLSMVPDTDVMTLNTTRGCIRKCKPCGTWIIEDKFTWKESVQREILLNKVVTYDNNLFGHPGIEQILEEMATTKVNGRVVIYESQSGFDARILVKKTHIAKLLKNARFQRPRIAWDNGMEEYPIVDEAIKLLQEAGYQTKEIMVFLLYNYELDYELLENKRKWLGWMGVQVSDCRYRPLDLLEDKYKPGKLQPPGEYYIHPNWSDNQVKEFRRRCRGQNIMVRFLDRSKAFDHSAIEAFKKNHIPDVVIDEFIPGALNERNRLAS